MWRYADRQSISVVMTGMDGSVQSMLASAVPLGTEILPFIPDAAELRRELISALSDQYEKRISLISNQCPASERESWPVQTEEARMLLAHAGAFTPWINAAAAARGIERRDLAQRIALKDDAYRAVHGAISGHRQRIEDQIDAAQDDVELMLEIDLTAGWPHFGA